MKNNKIISLALYAGVLKTVNRQGWIFQGIQKPESVAEHTFRTTFLAMILAPQHKGIDQTKIMKMALLHDMGESIVGDIVYERGRNVVAPLTNKQKDERNAIQEIFTDTADKEDYVQIWEEWEAQKTPEAKFLKQVEKLEMVIQAYEYEKKGHDPKLLDEFWEGANKYIEGGELESLFQELKALRKSHTTLWE